MSDDALTLESCNRARRAAEDEVDRLRAEVASLRLDVATLASIRARVDAQAEEMAGYVERLAEAWRERERAEESVIGLRAENEALLVHRLAAEHGRTAEPRTPKKET